MAFVLNITLFSLHISAKIVFLWWKTLQWSLHGRGGEALEQAAQGSDGVPWEYLRDMDVALRDMV